MSALSKYVALMKSHPDLFRNTGETGEITIIHDVKRIWAEQKRIRAELRANGSPEEWIEIGVLAEDQWFWVVRDLVEFPNGKISGYIRFINRKSNELGGFNVIMMCSNNNQILLIRKYHHEERGFFWEFPRGFGEPGLTAEENALKELEEEIGVKAKRLKLLSMVGEGKGGTAVFYAEIAPEQTITLDVGEGIITHQWVSVEELDGLVRQGHLQDWFSIWAYTLYMMMDINRWRKNVNKNN